MKYCLAGRQTDSYILLSLIRSCLSGHQYCYFSLLAGNKHLPIHALRHFYGTYMYAKCSSKSGTYSTVFVASDLGLHFLSTESSY